MPILETQDVSKLFPFHCFYIADGTLQRTSV